MNENKSVDFWEKKNEIKSRKAVENVVGTS